MKKIFLFILVALAGCMSTGKLSTETQALARLKTLDENSQEQINQLLSMIEEQARFINSSEIHYIPYEFRIPADSRKKREIQRIDSTIRFTNRNDSYQCIGQNATKQLVYEVLALPYTYKIKFCPFE